MKTVWKREQIVLSKRIFAIANIWNRNQGTTLTDLLQASFRYSWSFMVLLCLCFFEMIYASSRSVLWLVCLSVAQPISLFSCQSHLRCVILYIIYSMTFYTGLLCYCCFHFGTFRRCPGKTWACNSPTTTISQPRNTTIRRISQIRRSFDPCRAWNEDVWTILVYLSGY